MKAFISRKNNSSVNSKLFVMFSGETNDDIPIANSRFVMLLPFIVPIASFVCFFIVVTILLTSSGRLVPIDSIIRPNIEYGIFRSVASEAPVFTVIQPAIIIEKIAIGVRIKSISISFMYTFVDFLIFFLCISI